MLQELTADQIGNRSIARQNSQAAEDVVKIQLDKIVIREGFNVRQDYGDLNGLATSILENGQTIPGRVDVLSDGSFMLVDGHRRFKAIQMLSDMGHDANYFKAIVNNSRTTEEQRILQMFTTQDNQPLKPEEVAELISRLINLGYTQAEVSRKIGKTPAYISQMLSFANESPIIKDQVKNGNLNIGKVLKLQKEIPVQSDRIEAVRNAVQKQQEAQEVSENESGDESIKPKAKAPVTSLKIEDVTGKDKRQIKAEEMAKEIATLYSIEVKDIEPMVSLIKSYL